MSKLSFCGLNCEECPVYQATQNKDVGHQIWLAAEYSCESVCLTRSQMTCSGCHSGQRLESHMCQGCAIRACAINRVEHSCAECVDYPCALIERFVPVETDARNQLDYIKQSILV